MRSSARFAAALSAAALLALAGTTPAGAASSPSPADPPAVTRLTDDAGRTLDLRGFNLDKWDESTEADVRAIAERGFSLIRLDITWARLEPAPDRYDQAAMNRLQQLMSWADRYGLRVLVDFHQDIYGPAFGGGQDGAPAWATRDDGLPFTPHPDDWFSEYFEPCVQAAFRHLYDDADLRAAQAAFYQHVAAALRHHPSLLGYDLFNEPAGPVLGDPADPAVLVASVAALEQDRLPKMYNRLISAIRQVDERSWLFVEPTPLVGEGVPTALPGFSDPRHGAPRIGYAPHFYDTAVESGQDWNPADGFIKNYTSAITAYPAAHHLPVIVGEWGPPDADRPGNTALIAGQVQAMAGFATGWTMWYWAKGSGGYSVLDTQGDPHPGDLPVFAPYAPAVAGTTSGASYDPATRSYTLTYTPSGHGIGRTEIVLPASVYPHGVTVSTTGPGPGLAFTLTRQPVGTTIAGRVLAFANGSREKGAVTVHITARP